jgi:hypothetical protein
METRRKLRGPRCGLCLTCTNRAAPDAPAPGHRRASECLAGAEPRAAMYECESYVRVFTRGPHVPERFRRARS